MQSFIHDRNSGLIRSKTPQVSDNNQRLALNPKTKSYNQSILSRHHEALKSPLVASSLLLPMQYTKSEDKRVIRPTNKESEGSGNEFAPFCNGDKISFTTAEDKCETKAKKHNNQYYLKYSSED